MNRSNINNYIDKPVIFLLALMVLIPVTSQGLFARSIVLLLCLSLVLYKDTFVLRAKKNITALMLLMLANIFVSSAFGIINYINPNIALIRHELLRMILNILTLYIVINIDETHDFLYRVSRIPFLFISIIQFLQVLFPYQINDFISRFYVTEGQEARHLILATLQMGGANGIRAGSIFKNPNICGQIIVLFLSVFIIQYTIYKGIMPLLYSAIALVSIFLTGSRTAFILTIVIIFIFVFSDKGLNGFIKKGALVLITLLGLAYIIFSGAYLTNRSFDINNALERSLFVKVGYFIEYIKKSDFLELFFGGIGRSEYAQLDSEWGYILSYFGILGFLWYVPLLILIYKNKHIDKSIQIVFLMYIVLCGFTSTVLLSLQVSSLFLLISLAKYKTNDIMSESALPNSDS